MTSASARKGRRAEIAVAEYLRTVGFDHAEPTRRSGWADDRGDIDGIPGVVIEVKDQQRHCLPEWLRELQAEVENAGAACGVLVVKRKGYPNPADWYWINTGTEWTSMAKDAGL